MRNKNILFIFILLVASTANWQANAIDLKDKNQVEKVIRAFKTYDSLVLFTSTSYYKPIDSFLVIAYKNDNRYFLKGIIKSKRNTIKKIVVSQSNEITKELLTELKLLSLKKIETLNDDSLNNFINYNTKNRVTISHGTSYNMLVVNNVFNKTTFKTSYVIKWYQSQFPNADRKYYLDALYLLEKICTCSIIND